MQVLRNLIIKNWKAWAGGLVTAIGAYAAAHGWNLDMTLGQALEAVVYGLGGWVVVWFSPRNK